MSNAENKKGRIILLLGGARAGKSAQAQRLAAECEVFGSSVCFIATAQALDGEMGERIARHRAERPRHWRTIEEPYQLDVALDHACDAGIVIVDCLTFFASNWLLRHPDQTECEANLSGITRRFLELANSRQQTIICVSNEVGLGVVPATGLGRQFRDVLGRVNQDFAAAAAEVYFIVAGLPLRLKPTG